MKKFDVCVIGTGVAGTAIATRCADEGLRVAITDALPYGGTCALRGCDPKKILIDAAEVLDFARRMKGKGIDQEPRVAWPDLMAFKQEFTTPVPREKEKMFNEKGITTLHSRAKFVDENRLMIGNEIIEAEKFVVATGAQPRDLGIPGKEHAYTSSDFLELKELPESMLFIGGGYVAFEFAHLAAHCSTKITIVQRGEAPLKNFDQDIVAHLVEKTREIGIELVLNTEVTAIKKNSRGFLVTGDKNGHTKEFQADMVINSAGRVPEIRDLDLSKANVSHSEKGVEVNDFLQSVSNPRVYAAGDAAGTSLALTPVASMEADIVTDNILKGNHRMADYLETPTVVFTVPPMASVGP